MANQRCHHRIKHIYDLEWCEKCGQLRLWENGKWKILKPEAGFTAEDREREQVAERLVKRARNFVNEVDEERHRIDAPEMAGNVRTALGIATQMIKHLLEAFAPKED